MKFLTKNAKYVLPALSVLLLMATVYFSNDGSLSFSGEPPAPPPVPAEVRWFAEQDEHLQIGLDHEAITVACFPPGGEDPVLVAAFNGTDEDVDLEVETDLVDPAGGTIPAWATFARLRPGETRYMAPRWTEAVTSIGTCSVVAVQHDERLVRARS